MNDFIDAIKNNGSSDDFPDDVTDDQHDPSSERYDELKKEEANVERGTPAEKRYQEIKDKAKREMMREEQSKDEEPQEEHEENDKDEFITH